MKKVEGIHSKFMATCVNTNQPDPELCDLNNEKGVLARWGVCVEDANNDPGKLKDCVEVFDEDSKKHLGD